MSIQTNHHHDDNHGGAEASKLHRRRRRVKSLLLLAGVSFLAVILLDGVIQLTVLDGRSTVREDAAVMGTSGAAGRQLIVGNGNGADDNDVRMSTLTQKQQQLQPQQLQQQQLQRAVDNFPPANIINIEPRRSRRLHRLPLLPRHALRDRRRRQLYLEQKPLPSHLRDDFDNGMYHASHERRRRRYPVHREEEAGTLRTDRRRRETEQRQNDLEDQTRLYETGSLYQGYGTHYLDLWIGNPVPQRQTLIVDTGSSVTAFPCSRCRHCGTDDKVRFHLDGLYDESSSETFKEKDCRGENRGECSVGVCTDDSNNNNDNSNGEDRPYCKVDVAYAEGSTWTASEASDVVYPWGSFEEEEESGVENIADVGMGDYDDEREFHWKDFRLDFGCQTKVRVKYADEAFRVNFTVHILCVDLIYFSSCLCLRSPAYS